MLHFGHTIISLTILLHSLVSVSNFAILKHTLSFFGAILLEIKSSAFTINLVFSGIYFVKISDINPVCAFLIKESLNKFVQTKYVGVKYGYTLGALLSSISKTAKSFFAFPFTFTPEINAVVIPEFMLEP